MIDRCNRGRVTPKRAEGEPSAERYRKWVADNGCEVGARGWAPASIKKAYAAANN